MKILKSDLEKIINEEIERVLEINALHKKDGTWASKDDAEIYSLTKNAKLKPGTDSDLEVPARGKYTKSGKVSAKFGMNTGKPDKQCGKLTIDGSKKKKTRSCKDYPENYTEELLAEPGEGADEVLNNDPSATSTKNTRRPRKAIRVKILRSKSLNDEIDPIHDKKRERDKILPGYGDLQSLSRGIVKEQVRDVSLEELVAGLRDLLSTAPPEVVRQVADKMATVGFYSKDQAVRMCRRAGFKDLEGWLRFSNLSALAQKGEMFKKEKGK